MISGMPVVDYVIRFAVVMAIVGGLGGKMWEVGGVWLGIWGIIFFVVVLAVTVFLYVGTTHPRALVNAVQEEQWLYNGGLEGTVLLATCVFLAVAFGSMVSLTGPWWRFETAGLLVSIAGAVWAVKYLLR